MINILVIIYLKLCCNNSFPVYFCDVNSLFGLLNVFEALLHLLVVFQVHQHERDFVREGGLLN